MKPDPSSTPRSATPRSATPGKVKAALDRAARLVEQRPEVGQRSYLATATLAGDGSCLVREKGHELIADVPVSMGGGNAGPTPAALLRFAMASCVAIGIRGFAARAELDPGHVEVHFETDVDARGQLGVPSTAVPGFEAARLLIRVDSPADPVLLRREIDRSLEFSPLLDAVRCRGPIDIRIELRSEPAGER